VGQFASSALVVGSATLTLTGYTDVLVAKIGHQGSVQWATAFAGSGEDTPAMHAVAVSVRRGEYGRWEESGKNRDPGMWKPNISEGFSKVPDWGAYRRPLRGGPLGNPPS
jgi:hypothetical protein